MNPANDVAGGGDESWDVLVVDDEAVVREGIRRILEPRGFRVATASDAAGALAHPAFATCRLAVCDLVLPDRSGLGLIRAMTDARPDLPLVLITGYATTEQEARARCAGARIFLAKPFDEEELLAAVQEALGPREAASKER